MTHGDQKSSKKVIGKDWRNCGDQVVGAIKGNEARKLILEAGKAGRGSVIE